MVTKGQVSGVEWSGKVFSVGVWMEEGGGPALLGEELLCGDMFTRKPTFCDECRFLFPVPSQLLNMGELIC